MIPKTTIFRVGIHTKIRIAKELTKIAEAVCMEVFGNVDNKQFHAEKVTEIYDWIYNGDAQNLTLADVPALSNEWREYEDIK